MKSLYYRGRRRMPTEFLPESTDYFNRIAANGGSISNASMSSADRFVRDLCEAGLWPKMLEIGLFLGSNLDAAVVKLKYPPGGLSVLSNHNFVAGDYAETGANGGLLGDGALKYLQSETAPSRLGPTGHLSFYLRADLSGTDPRALLGAAQGAEVFSIAKADNDTDLLNSYGGGVTSTYGDLTRGFFCSVRAGPAALNLYKNGEPLGANAAPATVLATSNAIALWARYDGTSVSRYLDQRGSFYSSGAALNAAEAATFYRLVQGFQDTLARAV